MLINTVPPPMEITSEDVYARRVAKGIGPAEAKRELEHERLLVMIQRFDLTGKRHLLTEILFKIAERRCL